jgi:hypothetical protein
VPAFAASHIQHGSAVAGLQVRNKQVNKPARLLLIPVMVKQIIIRGIEPMLKPVFYYHNFKILFENIPQKKAKYSV